MTTLIHYRTLLTVILIGVLSGCDSNTKPAPTASPANAAAGLSLNQWFDARYEEELQFSPIQLSFLGRKERNHELGSFSFTAFTEELAWKKQTVEELRRLYDYDSLTPAEQISYDIWVYQYEQAAASANRLLQSFKHEDLPPIGLPTEATHVAFIIDTSGSMRNQMTGQLHYGVVEQIRELLESLPEVRSIQFLDTSGNYMLSSRRGFWLPDTIGLRQQALQQILAYPIASVSDPERGLRRAIRDLKPSLKAEDHMSIYVVGDDFRGSTQSLLIQLDRMNPRNTSNGKRPVSISAIGFPTLINPFQIGATQGNSRYANIMREIAEAHDGVLILKPSI